MTTSSALTNVSLLLCLQNHPVKITWAKADQQPHWDLPISSEVKYSNQWKVVFLPHGFRVLQWAVAHHTMQKVRPGTALPLKASPSLSSCMLEDHFCIYKIPLGHREDFRTCASGDAYPPPTSSATWHLRFKDEFERIPKNYSGKCTAGAKYHFTASESNNFL